MHLCKHIVGNCELYLADCLEILPTLTQIDAVVTSPPYDNIRTYEGNSRFDYHATIKGLFPAIKQGGVVMWNVADATVDGSETGTSFRQALAFMDAGFLLHDTMIYAKDSSSFPCNGRYENAFEYMFVFSNGKPATFNPLMDKKNANFGTRIHGTDRQRDGSLIPKKAKPVREFGKRLNWWEINHEQLCAEHPATMPLAMARDHVLSWTNPGEIVLDPFMGSGTTAVACIKTGRRFIGIEIEPKYFGLACRRIEEALRQPDMFIELPPPPSVATESNPADLIELTNVQSDRIISDAGEAVQFDGATHSAAGA